MNRDVTVRRFGPDEWRTYGDLRLRALADAPDSFSRTLAEERSRPDAEWAARLTAVADRDVPLLAEAHGEAVRLAWGRIDGSSPDEAHIYQMWVAPGHRGKGWDACSWTRS